MAFAAESFVLKLTVFNSSGVLSHIAQVQHCTARFPGMRIFPAIPALSLLCSMQSQKCFPNMACGTRATSFSHPIRLTRLVGDGAPPSFIHRVTDGTIGREGDWFSRSRPRLGGQAQAHSSCFLAARFMVQQRRKEANRSSGTLFLYPR